ncbi:transcriptional regulator, AraC family [Polaromonas sp. JS666]|nr:transcriptional regulator, AraC family [Polaromonas sp. JS666]
MICNQKFTYVSHSFKMIPPVRLDRLSALLEGLAPRVEMMRPVPGAAALSLAATPGQLLYLHLVAQGGVRLSVPGQDPVAVPAPAIVICRADTAHALQPLSGNAFEPLTSAQAFFDGPVASLLLGEFARPLVVPLDGADASLRHVIELISSELLEPRCGQPALLDRAGDILLIGLLRHLIAHPRSTRGLFNGLSDPRIAAALVAIHAAPQNDWNLDTLAKQAGMSRTSFATRFREVMGHPPGKYLGQVRLSIAHRAVQSGLGLKRAAKDSGYTSVSALSRALSRARVVD